MGILRDHTQSHTHNEENEKSNPALHFYNLTHITVPISNIKLEMTASTTFT